MTPSYNVADFANEAEYRAAHQQASHATEYPETEPFFSTATAMMLESNNYDEMQFALQCEYIRKYNRAMSTSQRENMRLQLKMNVPVKELIAQVENDAILNKRQIKKLYEM